MTKGRDIGVDAHLLQLEKARQMSGHIAILKVETDKLVSDTQLLLDRCHRLRSEWLNPVPFDTSSPRAMREAKTDQKQTRAYLNLPRKSL